MRFQMGIKNIRRNIRRSLINISTVAIAIFCMVIFESLMLGEWIDIVENYSSMGIGQVIITRKGYNEGETNQLNKLIDEPEEVIKRIKNIKGTRSVSLYLKTGCLFSFKGKQLPVLSQGVDFTREKNPIINSAGLPLPDRYEYKILIGRRLAEEFGLRKGDVIFLYGRTAYGTFNLIDLEVSGFFKAPLATFEKRTVYIPIDVLKEFLGTEGVSEISLSLRRDIDPSEMVNMIKQNIGEDYKVQSIMDYIPQLKDIRALQTGFLGLFWFILLLITVFGIVNIMLISVWERKKEIGTLRAIGYSKLDIIGIFLAEASGIGFIGGLIGILAGGIVAYIMQRYGIPLPSEALEGIDFPIQTRIYGILSGMVLVKSLVLAIVATTGGAIIPALRASGMKIIDAIREY